MIKTDMPIIVEGKYDKMKLSAIIDGVILETSGFGIFKDRELSVFIKEKANSCGIIVATDSDKAGFKIRNHIKSIAGKNAKIINVYIPQIQGKEKRKEKFSSEGFLGVEGMDLKTIEKSFIRAGVLSQKGEKVENIPNVTKTTLFEMGYVGCEQSAQSRRVLLKMLKLPSHINTNSLLKVLNTCYSKDEVEKILREAKK